MSKLCDKIRELHSHEKVVCIFSLMISAILLLNVIVDLIHIGISSSSRKGLEEKVDKLETRIEIIEEHMKLE